MQQRKEFSKTNVKDSNKALMRTLHFKLSEQFLLFHKGKGKAI